jgi:hypothetical protein
VYGKDSTSGGTAWAGYFSGNVNVTGKFESNGTCEFNTSDRRLKQNIEPLKGARDRLLQLKGVTYQWRDPAAQGNQRGSQIGFIAQDVEKVVPGWVGENANGFKTLTISPTQLAAMQVEALREQQEEINDLKVQLKELRDARPPRITMNPSWSIGVAGLAVGAFVFTRRRRSGSETKA